jgi:hypothetical protein
MHVCNTCVCVCVCVCFRVCVYMYVYIYVLIVCLPLLPYTRRRARLDELRRTSSLTHAYVRIRQDTSGYVSIRQHTSALRRTSSLCRRQVVSIRIRQHFQHFPAFVSIRQHTSAYVSIRQHTSAYVSIRHHTSAYDAARSPARMPSLVICMLYRYMY